MANLAIGVSVTIYYDGPTGATSVIGTVADLQTEFVTVTNTSGTEVSIGWAAINMIVS